jgi:putative phage-type endonuclease
MSIIQDAVNLEQGTDEWKIARLGYVSASNLDAVMAKGKSGEAITRKKYKVRLAAERLTGEITESYSNASMEWGVVNEEKAAMAYEVSKDTFLDRTGFWKHPTIPWLGCSPDRLVGGDGLVEIKCPDSSTHIDYWLAKQVPSEYVKQVQGQIWVMEREWCDFVSFDPRMPEKNRLLVVRAYRDETLIKQMQEEVEKFLDEVEQLIIKLGE